MSEQIQPKMKVILLKTNVLVPTDFLVNSPSRDDGCSVEDEIKLRIAGCERIQHAGRLLELPQPAIATAQIIFQRFYLKKSMITYNIEVFAIASVVLAGKYEEHVRRIRDVVNVFKYIEDMEGPEHVSKMFECYGTDYIKMKGYVIDAERRILKELGFLVHVQHSHKWIVSIAKIIGCELNIALLQTAWNYMNDSFKSPVFLFHQSEYIGCACIYLAARNVKVLLPVEPGWWEIFGMNEAELIDISKQISYLYTLPRIDIKSIWANCVSKVAKPIQCLYERILCNEFRDPKIFTKTT